MTAIDSGVERSRASDLQRNGCEKRERRRAKPVPAAEGWVAFQVNEYSEYVVGTYSEQAYSTGSGIIFKFSWGTDETCNNGA